MDSKRRWVAFAATVRGRVTINANARDTLLDPSQLAHLRVTACEGDFSSGQVITAIDAEGNLVEKGNRRVRQPKLSARFPGGLSAECWSRRKNLLLASKKERPRGQEP